MVMIGGDVGGGDDDWWRDEIGLGSPGDVAGDVRMSLVMLHRKHMSVSVPASHAPFQCMSQSMGG